MAKSQNPGRRNSLLPPELDAIDDAWGADEQPTVPAREAPIPTGFASEAPTLPKATLPTRPSIRVRPSESTSASSLKSARDARTAPARPGSMLERLRAQGLLDSEQPPVAERETPLDTTTQPDADFGADTDRGAATERNGGRAPKRPPSEQHPAVRRPTSRQGNPLLGLGNPGGDASEGPPLRTEGIAGHPSERVTKRPSSPADYSSNTVHSAAATRSTPHGLKRETETLSPQQIAAQAEHASRPLDPPPELRGDLGELRARITPSSGAPTFSDELDEDDEVFDRPTIDALVDPETGAQREPHPSEMPTAPPPDGFDMRRMRTVPRPASVDNLAQAVAPAEPSLPPQPAISQRGLASRPASPSISEMESPLQHPSINAAADPEQDMRDRFAMGDFSGALEQAEAILTDHPGNAEARSLSEKCREVLYDMYASRIGDMQRVPTVTMAPDQIRWLSLDHRAGFLLSMIDGVSTVDDLLDVCGMKRLDAMRLLCSLLDQKVISLH